MVGHLVPGQVFSCNQVTRPENPASGSRGDLEDHQKYVVCADDQTCTCPSGGKVFLARNLGGGEFKKQRPKVSKSLYRELSVRQVFVEAHVSGTTGHPKALARLDPIHQKVGHPQLSRSRLVCSGSPQKARKNP